MIKEKTYYRCPDYYLLVYPTLEKAASARRWSKAEGAQFATLDYEDGSTATAAVAGALWAAHVADFWSEKLNCKVRHINPNDLIFVINKVEEKEKTYLFCLFPNFSGWIIWEDWLEYKILRI